MIGYSYGRPQVRGLYTPVDVFMDSHWLLRYTPNRLPYAKRWLLLRPLSRAVRKSEGGRRGRTSSAWNKIAMSWLSSCFFRPRTAALCELHAVVCSKHNLCLFARHNVPKPIFKHESAGLGDLESCRRQQSRRFWVCVIGDQW